MINMDEQNESEVKSTTNSTDKNSSENSSKVEGKTKMTTATDATSSSTTNSTTTSGIVIPTKPRIIPTLTRIAPKPAPTSTSTTTAGSSGTVVATAKTATATNGQIVLIQSPGGTSQKICISGTTGTTGTGGIQFIKTADGHFLQLKQKPTVVSASSAIVKTTQSTDPQTQMRRFIVKGNSGQQVLLSTATRATPTAASTTAGTSASTTTRTYTVSQAQQMGLLSAAKIKELVSQATTQKKIQSTTILPATTTVKTAAIKVSSVSSQPTQKIIVQTAGGVQRPVTLPQNIVKLAQSGQIKAVNVAGKGIQYVRVSNPTANLTATTTPATTESGSNVPVKAITTTGQSGASKVVIQNKAGGQQTLTLINQLPSTSGVVIKQTVPNPVNNKSQKVQSNNVDLTESTIKSEKSEENGNTPIPVDVVNLKDKIENEKIALPVYRESLKSDHSMPNVTFKVEPDVVTHTETHFDLAKASPEGPRRKHCNCTKSQCLKLYCDCFANGEFCFNCNCKECFNNLENEEERLKAIKLCLERNPHAFKPKIGKSKDQNEPIRRHTKGCNCKRSGCLKNYCECYEAKICCSGNCKCIGCRNVEETYNGRMGMGYLDTTMIQAKPVEVPPQKRTFEKDASPLLSAKKPCNFMTQDVIEATIQCVIAQADDCQQKKVDKMTAERLILEEFGRCLVEIIEFSMKNTEN